MPLDVRQVPPLKLTVVPFLLQAEPDSSILEAIAGLAEDSDLLWQLRTLAPVGELKVDLHEPVYTSSDDAVTVVLHTEAIRKMEDDEAGSWSSSYWLGMMSVFHVPSGWWGTAIGTGRSSTSSAHGRIIAHELLHNMEALHAPCNQPEGRVLDYHYPHSEGQIGSIGYDFRRKELVAPSAGWDVMGSYFCNPMWISDYTFSKALSHRLTYEGNARPDRSLTQLAGGQRSVVARRSRALLLWGLIDADGTPSLNPAFVVDAQPSLPVGGGSHQITGQDADGRLLFRLRFDPQEVHHGGGRSVFAFTLPLRSEWAETMPTLARITLVGPGGIDRPRRNQRSLHGFGTRSGYRPSSRHLARLGLPRRRAFRFADWWSRALRFRSARAFRSGLRGGDDRRVQPMGPSRPTTRAAEPAINGSGPVTTAESLSG